MTYPPPPHEHPHSESNRRYPKHLRLQVVKFYFVFGLFFLSAIVIGGRLLWLQVWDSPYLSKKAHQARHQSYVIYNRGKILDRNGVIMAQDKVLYDIYAHPQFFWKVKPHEVAKALSPFVGKPWQELKAEFSKDKPTITIAKNIQKHVISEIRKARIIRPVLDEKTQLPVIGNDGQVMTSEVPIPGLDFAKKSVRAYPQGTLAAHVLGYVNDEANLQSGIESTAKNILKAKPSFIPEDLQVDGHGDYLSMESLDSKTIATIPQGEDVVLTIDSRLQYIAERELEAGLERNKAKRGVVIMMEPHSGDVLAFAVRPSYNPEKFLKAPYDALKNWALSDVYPPGSVFKILTVACGLETGVINEHSKILDTGKMTISGWTITNYDYGKRGAPGMIDLNYLLVHSSNIASAKISMMMPVKKHWKLLHSFGFGNRTGIDLPGESRGILLPEKDWDLATHASLGYGYGLAATPLQMIAAVNAIANKGVWIEPHLVKQPHPKGLKRHRVLSEKTAKAITKLLADSIAESKTHPANQVEGVRVAGKTGTSRRPKEGGRGYDSALYTSFMGFYPAEDPKAIILVVIDSPGVGNAWGSTIAAPIFRELAKESLPFLELKPATISSKASPNHSPKGTG